MTPVVDVTVRHLEMTSRDQLRPSAAAPASGIHLTRVDTGQGIVARTCYHLVGGPWQWTDRIDWDVEQWQELLDEEQGELWVARDGETIVGYAQLARRTAAVQIHYFGLAPGYIGRGLGGWLLTRAVERAWAMGAAKVTLNTCTLDAPAALSNYLARGFAVVREEQRSREVADGPH